jgi:hypothetical protein
MTLKEKFIETVNKVVVRDGIDDLMEWLGKTDFYNAPASTRFHEVYEGGLVEHSVKVYEQLRRIVFSNAFNFGPNDVTEESIAIVALFHDLCKINCYKTEMRWRKDKNDRWEQYPTYKFEEDFSFGGHGSKSVYLIQNFMKLEPDEAVAINCHMGVEDGKWKVVVAFRKWPLAFLLHVADMASTISQI